MAFGLLLALLTGLLTGPLAVEAQQPPRAPRLGVLVNADSPRVEAFRQGLREQGYIDGRNIVVDYRYASARSADSPDVLARELVQLRVDLIVTEGTPLTLAARRATDSIRAEGNGGRREGAQRHAAILRGGTPQRSRGGVHRDAQAT